MNQLVFFAAATGLAALLCAAWLSSWIAKNNEGSERMKEIASYIREGAMAFLLSEYRTIVIFIVVMSLLLTFLPGLGIGIAVALRDSCKNFSR